MLEQEELLREKYFFERVSGFADNRGPKKAGCRQSLAGTRLLNVSRLWWIVPAGHGLTTGRRIHPAGYGLRSHV